jgi:hypothetical protein
LQIQRAGHNPAAVDVINKLKTERDSLIVLSTDDHHDNNNNKSGSNTTIGGNHDNNRYKKDSTLFVSNSRHLYARVHTVLGMKEALVHNGPCVVVLPHYEDSPDTEFWVPRSNVTSPDEIGHAMAFVGYSDKEQAFLARNDWGSEWNGNGHVWVPYQHVADGRMWEMWTLFYDGKRHLEYFRQLKDGMSHPMYRDDPHASLLRFPGQNVYVKTTAAAIGSSMPTTIITGALAGSCPPQQKQKSSAWVFWGILLLLLVIVGAVVAATASRCKKNSKTYNNSRSQTGKKERETTIEVTTCKTTL